MLKAFCFCRDGDENEDEDEVSQLLAPRPTTERSLHGVAARLRLPHLNSPLGGCRTPSSFPVDALVRGCDPERTARPRHGKRDTRTYGS